MDNQLPFYVFVFSDSFSVNLKHYISYILSFYRFYMTHIEWESIVLVRPNFAEVIFGYKTHIFLFFVGSYNDCAKGKRSKH
jgi:hypothetical protein